MINYVNNSFDNVLKPCDAQQFYTLTQSEKTERLILAHRAGEPKAKSKLPALTYMGVFDKDKYRKYLETPSNSPSMGRTQASRNKGTRKAEFMRPTGLLMLDFDHITEQATDPLPTSPSMGRGFESPTKMWEQIYKGASERGFDLGKCMALAHITPSGDGLRLVVTRDKGKSIAECQYHWAQEVLPWLGVTVKCDDVCKDISRLSYAPMKSEILYFNSSLLFAELPDAADYPDGSLFGSTTGYPLRSVSQGSTALVPLKEGQCSLDSSIAEGANKKELSPFKGRSEVFRGLAKCQAVPSEGSAVPCTTEADRERNGVERNVAEGVSVDANHTTSPLRGTPPILGGESYPTDYNGIEYSEIIRRLEEQLGGRPAQGARNSFIFTMACNLRYICNDDAAWVASILPTYGEEPQKHRATIQSAINRPMSRNMPETLKRALQVALESSEVAEGGSQPSTLNPHPEALPPAMPTILPEPIALLTSRTPERMQAAVAMAVFPPLGAHVCGMRFTYWDGRDYEPTFMNVVVAELSAGKSAVNTPIEYIIADMEVRDEVAREQERGWREKCALIKNPDDRPERPKGLVRQVLSADMTNAAFVQRLADANGHFLYTQMDEIELLNALKTNTTSGTVTAVLRLAFDCGKYGQERVAANAIDMKAQVRWNWNASSTVQRVRKFFARSVADGTLSRISFATIVRKEGDYGRERPKYGQYGQAFADELRPYIDALCNTSGTIVCPEAQEWASALCDELSDFAEECEDDTYAQFSFRAVLMGFFRAMLLYVMNGCQWTQTIADFAAWTVKYDLWCKMRFFSDMVHKDLAGEKTSLQVGPVSLLTLLPDEFTREDVRNLRIAQGMKPDPTNMIKAWKNRGQILQTDERCVYTKIKGVQGTGYN